MNFHQRAFAARFAVAVALLALVGTAPPAGALPPASFQAWLMASTVFLDDFEAATTCPWSAVQPPDPATCDNGLQNGCETDVDCGGRNCGACANFQNCLVDLDCLSGMCSNGTCAECLSAANCPGEDTECATRTCTQLACGIDPTPFGTAIAFQTAGDCQLDVCDGFGETTGVPDDGDLPDDGNQCTVDLCAGGVPMFDFEDAGTPCTQNGGASCDGNGNCV